jgi:ABC-type spermidine/putrescine transport system permease subunit II
MLSLHASCTFHACSFSTATGVWSWLAIEVLKYQRFPFHRHKGIVIALCIAPPVVCAVGLMILRHCIDKQQQQQQHVISDKAD